MLNWTSLEMVERIVINTGPLIALARMDALDVPSQLPYERIFYSKQSPRLKFVFAPAIFPN
jgi:hypothetical protein